MLCSEVVFLHEGMLTQYQKQQKGPFLLFQGPRFVISEVGVLSQLFFLGKGNFLSTRSSEFTCMWCPQWAGQQLRR